VRDIPEDGPIKISKHVGERNPTVANSATSVHTAVSSLFIQNVFVYLNSVKN
jgi:hypothetical protein